jgi:hypothetical protein
MLSKEPLECPSLKAVRYLGALPKFEESQGKAFDLKLSNCWQRTFR